MGIYGNIGAFNGLGKPTIKLEFDNNEALLDFQRRMQNAGDAESYNNATWYDIPSTPETVPAVFDGLGTPGDTYIITDTRKRARKKLQDTALFKKFDIQKFDTPENSPATLAPGDASGVILVPIFDLNFDTKNFQNRQEEFSETSVNRIIDAVDDGDFNWAVFDPITVWKNPQDGKLYVLSGHSRSEAFKRLAMAGKSAQGKKFDRIPAKIFEGSFEEAKELALNSNTLSTKETDIERANYYRDRRAKLIEKGVKVSDIKKQQLEQARKNEGKNANRIIYLSYLRPRGLTMYALAALQNSDAQSSERMKVAAEWIGHLMYAYPQLTEMHENELYNFLVTSGHYGRDVRNFAEFAKRIQTAIEKNTQWGQFAADKSLNLEKNLGKSENEKRFDEELARLKDEWSKAEATLTRKLGEFKARQKSDTTITDEQIINAVRPYKDAAIVAKANYLAFRDKRGQFLQADDKQLALFGGDLEGYGDLYTVRDNRKRAKKEPGELLANKNLVFTKQTKDIINYNHTLDTAAYKHIDIERNSAFGANKVEWKTKFGFFECLKKSNETEEDNNYYRKGKDGKTYKGTIRHFDVLIDNESELFNIQDRYYNKSSQYYKADISLQKYNELEKKAFGSFWDSLKRSITYAKNELEKEKKSLYSSEKWLKQAEERLKDAIKIYKYNCNFYGIKNEYENLGKTANNSLYNDNSIIDCRGLKPTYTILSDYSAFFDAAKQNTSFAGFGLDDTLKLIADTCRKHYKECSKIAAHLKGDCKLQSAFNLWHWLRHNIRYEYDREGREEVRAPLRTWADRARGVDCDCLSVFAWCVLKCMGYDPVFELVAFRNKPQFSHIFVNLDGIVVDRVWFIFNSRPPLVTKNKIYKVDLFNSLGKLF